MTTINQLINLPINQHVIYQYCSINESLLNGECTTKNENHHHSIIIIHHIGIRSK